MTAHDDTRAKISSVIREIVSDRRTSIVTMLLRVPVVTPESARWGLAQVFFISDRPDAAQSSIERLSPIGFFGKVHQSGSRYAFGTGRESMSEAIQRASILLAEACVAHAHIAGGVTRQSVLVCDDKARATPLCCQILADTEETFEVVQQMLSPQGISPPDDGADKTAATPVAHPVDGGFERFMAGLLGGPGALPGLPPGAAP